MLPLLIVAAVSTAPAYAATPNGFGPSGASKCRNCESAKSIREGLSVTIPEHAIVLDFGNGPFWRNSRLVIVDLDLAETFTYRFPIDQDHPTELRLAGRQPISAGHLRDLIAKANSAWNPPASKWSPTEPMRTDVFETIYVVDGQVMARWLGGGGDPAWYTALVQAVRSSERPTAGAETAP